MTLGALSEASGIGASTIGNYENEKTEASTETLKKLADVLRVSVEEITKVVPAKNSTPSAETSSEPMSVREPAPTYHTRTPRDPDPAPANLGDISDDIMNCAINDVCDKIQNSKSNIDQYNAVYLALMYLPEFKLRLLKKMSTLDEEKTANSQMYQCEVCGECSYAKICKHADPHVRTDSCFTKERPCPHQKKITICTCCNRKDKVQ